MTHEPNFGKIQSGHPKIGNLNIPQLSNSAVNALRKGVGAGLEQGKSWAPHAKNIEITHGHAWPNGVFIAMSCCLYMALQVAGSHGMSKFDVLKHATFGFNNFDPQYQRGLLFSRYNWVLSRIHVEPTQNVSEWQWRVRWEHTHIYINT